MVHGVNVHEQNHEGHGAIPVMVRVIRIMYRVHEQNSKGIPVMAHSVGVYEEHSGEYWGSHVMVYGV